MRLLSIVNIGLLLFPGSEHVLNQAHPRQECRDLMYLILPVQNLTALLGRINCFDLFFAAVSAQFWAGSIVWAPSPYHPCIIQPSSSGYF